MPSEDTPIEDQGDAPANSTAGQHQDRRRQRVDAQTRIRERYPLGSYSASILLLGLPLDFALDSLRPFIRGHNEPPPRILMPEADSDCNGIWIKSPTDLMIACAHRLAAESNIRVYELNPSQTLDLSNDNLLRSALQRESSYTPLRAAQPFHPRIQGRLDRAAERLAVPRTTEADTDPTDTQQAEGSTAQDRQTPPTASALALRSETWTYTGSYLRSVFRANNDTPMDVALRDVLQRYDFPPCPLHFCPTEAQTDEVKKIATLTYKRLVHFLDGTSGFYPPGYRFKQGRVTTLDYSARTYKWFHDHATEVTVAGYRTDRVQDLADRFSNDMGIARLHAVEFLDRRPTASNEKSKTTPQVWFEIQAFAFLLLVDLIHHPPPWADPDALFMLRTLDTRELSIHLTMTRADLEGMATCRAINAWHHTRRIINALPFPADRRAAWNDLLVRMQCGQTYWEESRMAAGGIPHAPVLEVDHDRYDFQPRPPPTTPPITHLLVDDWTTIPLDTRTGGIHTPTTGRASSNSPANKFDAVLQDSGEASPLCGIVIRGIRTGEFGQPPISSSTRLAESMTPPFTPSSTRFTKVCITRIAFKEVDEGVAEVSFVFACPAHAAVAWHTTPSWLHLLDLDLPEAVLTADIEGDRHPLCKLVFEANSWIGTPSVWEFQRAFGHPALHAQAVSARMISRSITTLNPNSSTGDKRKRAGGNSLKRKAALRVTYAHPALAHKMLGQEVLMFAHGTGTYTSAHASSPGRPYISVTPVEICDNCAHFGHTADTCHAPVPAPSSVSATSQCRTCLLVPNWDSCGRTARCRLAVDFDANTKLMAEAATRLSTSTGYFGDAGHDLRQSLFDSAPATPPTATLPP